MEQLFQVVLKRSPSEQQLVVDLIPVENSEKLHRTHCARYDTHASKKNAMTHVKLPECETPIIPPKSQMIHLSSPSFYFMDTLMHKHFLLISVCVPVLFLFFVSLIISMLPLEKAAISARNAVLPLIGCSSICGPRLPPGRPM